MNSDVLIEIESGEIITSLGKSEREQAGEEFVSCVERSSIPVLSASSLKLTKKCLLLSSRMHIKASATKDSPLSGYLSLDVFVVPGEWQGWDKSF